MTAKSDGSLIRMFARATHFYPGCILLVEQLHTDKGQPHEAVVEMSDGVGVSATFVLLRDDTIELKVAPWKTAKGTSIKGKTWALHQVDAQDSLWKVAKPRS